MSGAALLAVVLLAVAYYALSGRSGGGRPGGGEEGKGRPASPPLPPREGAAGTLRQRGAGQAAGEAPPRPPRPGSAKVAPLLEEPEGGGGGGGGGAGSEAVSPMSSPAPAPHDEEADGVLVDRMSLPPGAAEARPGHQRDVSFSAMSPSPSVFYLASEAARSVQSFLGLAGEAIEEGSEEPSVSSASSASASSSAAPAPGPAGAEPSAPPRRAKILEEIVESERKYLFFLHAVVRDYATPLGKTKLLPPEDLAGMFSNLPELARFHEMFLDDLQRAEGRLGPVFVKSAPFLRMYAAYCSGYDRTLELVDRLMSKKKGKKFLDDVRKRHARAHNQQGLLSLLIMPIQRIPRYKMLLEDLVKHTAAGSDELPALREALALVSGVADTVNERKRRAEAMSDLLQIQNRCGAANANVRLFEPHRHLVRRKDLVLRRGSSRKTYSALLFNDSLLLVSSTSFRFKAFIELGKSIAMRDDAAPNPRLAFLIIDGKAEQRYFECASEKERDDWLADVEAGCAWAREHLAK